MFLCLLVLPTSAAHSCQENDPAHPLRERISPIFRCNQNSAVSVE